LDWGLLARIDPEVFQPSSMLEINKTKNPMNQLH